MDTELLNCPRCGAPAEMFASILLIKESSTPATWGIRCKAPLQECSFFIKSTDKDLVRQWWNTVPRGGDNEY